MLETFDDLIAAFDGSASMAETLGLVRTAIPNWRRRGSIPPRQWPLIVDAAAARGVDGVTYDALRRIRFNGPDISPPRRGRRPGPRRGASQ